MSQPFLLALQLADSFFPTGMYAHSQGLEGMVRRGLVRTPEDVEELLRNQLAWSVLPADGLALLEAYRAAAAYDFNTIIDIDHLLYALRLPAELRAASCQIGRRLLDETEQFGIEGAQTEYRARVRSGGAPGNAAVALGVIAHAHRLDEGVALLAFCHSYAVGVLGAAMRLLPLTHSQVQGILHRLHPLIAELADEIQHRPWTEMASFTPELDLAAIGHESDDLRMFAS